MQKTQLRVDAVHGLAACGGDGPDALATARMHRARDREELRQRDRKEDGLAVPRPLQPPGL